MPAAEPQWPQPARPMPLMEHIIHMEWHFRMSKAKDSTDALDRLTHHAETGAGVTQSLFFVGDGLQRVLTDGFFDLFRTNTWAPHNIFRLTSVAARATAQLSEFLPPEQLGLARQELQ